MRLGYYLFRHSVFMAVVKQKIFLLQNVAKNIKKRPY